MMCLCDDLCASRWFGLLMWWCSLQRISNSNKSWSFLLKEFVIQTPSYKRVHWRHSNHISEAPQLQWHLCLNHSNSCVHSIHLLLFSIMKWVLKIRYWCFLFNYEISEMFTLLLHQTDLADVLSVLAMTMGKEGERESLKYKLEASKEPVGSWGHEYVRYASYSNPTLCTHLSPSLHLFIPCILK